MFSINRFIPFFLPLIAGLVISIFPYLGFDFGYLPGDLGDTRFNLFLLEHANQFIQGDVQHFWDGGFMYPEAEVISLSSNLIGSAPFYFLFRVLGADIFSAFQYWFILLAILNYWSAFKLTDYLVNNKWLAGLSAFVYAFSISLSSQMNHAQTFPRYAIPLIILGLLLWRKHLHWKYFAFAITLLVYQFYCGIYLGFLTSIPFLIIFIFTVSSNYKAILESFKKRKIVLFYSASILLNLVLLYELFAPYIRRSRHVNMHQYSEISQSLPEVKSFLSAPPKTLIHEPLNNFIGDHPAFWDHWIFPGWIALLFFVISVVFIFRRWLEKSIILSKEHYLICLTGLFTFLIFLRIDNASIYFFVHQLPGFSAMRSLTRVINVELLFFGAAIAIVILYFIKKIKVSSVLIFAVLLPLLVIDNYRNFDAAYKVPVSVLEDRHNNLVKKMEGVPKTAIVSYEPDTLIDPADLYQLDAMLAAQSLHLKTINGYSAQAALNFHKFWSKPNEENRLFWFDRFPKSDTISVVVIK